MSASDSLISVRHVSKSFAGAGAQQIPVLEGVDLEVADSEFVALLGRSGSGKSTLLRCMAGLIAPSVYGLIKDAAGGSDTLALLVVAAAPVMAGAVLVALGHDRRLERIPGRR